MSESLCCDEPDEKKGRKKPLIQPSLRSYLDATRLSAIAE